MEFKIGRGKEEKYRTGVLVILSLLEKLGFAIQGEGEN